ncbi:MAG: ECF-type sigma factor [Planctomycetota bacterium]
MSGANEVTQYLRQLDAGGQPDVGGVLPFVYDELHALAQRALRRARANHTLQPTALVHEAYLRLVGAGDASYNGRQHFLAVAALAMRQILANYARDRSRLKRGGGKSPVLLDEGAVFSESTGSIELIDLHEALSELEKLNERQARIAELRFLAGLSVEETAQVLDLSPRTVKLDWKMARAFLSRRLHAEENE